MDALVFDGPGQIRFATDVPDPVVVDPGDVVVEVLAAGLCGSDLHSYLGREAARPGVVPGHEVVGRVTDVGPAVTAVEVGDRAVVPFSVSCGTCPACRRGLSSRCERSRLLGWGDPDPAGPVLHGGQAGYLRVPMADGSLVPIDDRITDDEGILLGDNLPTGWYAALRGGVGPGSRVVVIGLGAVGLCAVVAAQALGAAEVMAIDPVTSRRRRAEVLGAVTATPAAVDSAAVDSAAVDSAAVDSAAVDLADIDVAIDAAGPPAAQRLAAHLVRPGGTVSIIAVQTDAAFAIDPVSAYDKNLTITAGRAPVRSLLDDLLPRVLDGSLIVPSDVLITHPGMPLADGPSLYRRFADREDGMVKVTFAPRRRPQV